MAFTVNRVISTLKWASQPSDHPFVPLHSAIPLDFIRRWKFIVRSLLVRLQFIPHTHTTGPLHRELIAFQQNTKIHHHDRLEWMNFACVRPNVNASKLRREKSTESSLFHSSSSSSSEKRGNNNNVQTQYSAFRWIHYANWCWEKKNWNDSGRKFIRRQIKSQKKTNRK